MQPASGTQLHHDLVDLLLILDSSVDVLRRFTTVLPNLVQETSRSFGAMIEDTGSSCSPNLVGRSLRIVR